jgi:CheY-like chemotaxis protein
MEPGNRLEKEEEAKNNYLPLLCKTKSILLLDDEVDVVSIIKHYLQRQGFVVYVFTNPLLALDHFQLNYQNYDLVISDTRMHSMTGVEFARKVRKINRSIKILLMSAFDTDNESYLTKLLLSIKIDGFFHKPISPDELINVFKRYLCNNKSQSQPEQQQSQKMRNSTTIIPQYPMFPPSSLETIVKAKEEKAYNYNRFKRTLYYLINGTKGGHNRARILETLNLHPTNANQIAYKLKLHYKTILYHLSILSHYKLILNDRKESYGATYFLTPNMRKNYHVFLEIKYKLREG